MWYYCSLSLLTKDRFWMLSAVQHCIVATKLIIYISEQCSVCLLRISFSSVRQFQGLCWIFVDLPCLYDVGSFTSWNAVFLFVSSSTQISDSWHRVPIYSFFSFFRANWILLLGSLYSFTPFLLLHAPLPQVLSIITDSGPFLVTHGLFLRCYFTSISLAVSVAAVL